MLNVKMNQEHDFVQVEIQFLDYTFFIQIPPNIDLDELFEIVEKFIVENPHMSIDLKTLSKQILDTEYYTLTLKQNDNPIINFNEIQHGIPLRLEIESDSIKKRYYTKKHIKATFKHIDSISINEFANMFNIKNIVNFRQIITNLSKKYSFSVTDDIIKIDDSLTKDQLKFFANELLDNVDY